MRFDRTLLFIITIPLASTAGPAKPSTAQNFRFASKTSALDIPFELHTNHIYLKVRVNGSDPLWFILDTGANASAVVAETAPRLGLHAEPRDSVGGAGENKAPRSWIEDVSLSLPGLEVTALKVLSFPLKAIEPFFGQTVDGLLGCDFFERFAVEIDYSARKIHVHDARHFEYRGPGKRIPIDIHDCHPYVEARIDEKLSGTFMVDTGVRAALMLNRPFCEKNTLPRPDRKALMAPIGFGVGGPTHQLMGRIDSLAVGPFTLPGVVTSFSKDRAGILTSSRFDGILGGEFLRRFRVIFDYSRGEMILEPTPALNEAMEYDMSGLFLTARDPGFRTYIVENVLNGSPADRAGLMKGDVLMTIDGKATRDYGFDEIQSLLKRHDVVCRLTVRREGQTVATRIIMRRMI
jgi:hypothetical protein